MIRFDYGGKCVLVTGAGGGLGFAIARAFHNAGASVVVNDRTAESVSAAVDRLGGGSRLIAAPADLSSAAGCAEAVAPALRRGSLDYLVNNAAINIERPIRDTDDAQWDSHIAVIVKAAFFTVKHTLPLLKASRGAVINVASELGLHAIPNNVAYVSAKHGLIAMTRAMAMELAPFEIRVNTVCPGTMDTELMRECAIDSGDADAYYRNFRAYHPLNRLANAGEIADFVLCLVSPAAAFATGSAFVIDGGSTAGRL